MCFTVNVNLVREELENRFGAVLIDPDKYRPSYYYNAFSLPDIPAICSGMTKEIRMVKWGLIPSWVKSMDDANFIRYKTFNARGESIDQKPSFSESFRSKRCVIPIKGFYEWQHSGNDKIPWYIFDSHDEIMSLAGLYNDWTERSTGTTISTFSIVTTTANNLMAEIHNSGRRMPFILDRLTEKLWLDNSLPANSVTELIKPSPEASLNAHTISKLINDRSTDRNRADIIKPFNYSVGNLLF